MLDTEDKKVAANKLGLNCGSLYIGELDQGHGFCSRLIEVIGDVLIFETKGGSKYFHKVSELKHLTPYTPRFEVV